MSVNVLEGLEESEVLVGVSSDGKVVDGGVSDDSLVVNDVGGSVSNSDVSVLAKASVGLGDFLVEVSNEGDVHGSKSSFFSGLEGVLHV